MLRSYLSRLHQSAFTLPSAFWVLWSGTLVNRTGTLVLPFLTLYLTSVRHVSVSDAGLVAGFAGGGGILASLFMSMIADRTNRRYLLSSVLGIAALLMLPILFISSLPLLAIAVFLWSTVSEIQRPLSQVLVIDLVPSNQRQQSIALLRAAINGGAALGGVLGGLIAAVAYVPLFLIDASTNLFFALLTFFRFSTRPSPRQQKEKHPPFILTFAPLRKRAFLLLWLSTFCVATIDSQLYSIFPVYLLQKGGTTSLYGSLLALNAVLIVLVEFPLATALSRFSPSRTMSVGYLLVTAAVGICLVASSPLFFILPVLTFTIGESLFAPSSGTVVANIAPPEQRSAYVGLSWMAGNLGFIAGPILGGSLLHLSPLLYWAVLLAVGLLSTIFAWSIPRDAAHVIYSNAHGK
jgi:MFS family permease